MVLPSAIAESIRITVAVNGAFGKDGKDADQASRVPPSGGVEVPAALERDGENLAGSKILRAKKRDAFHQAASPVQGD